jgi:hypothetical protein
MRMGKSVVCYWGYATGKLESRRLKDKSMCASHGRHTGHLKESWLLTGPIARYCDLPVSEQRNNLDTKPTTDCTLDVWPCFPKCVRSQD